MLARDGRSKAKSLEVSASGEKGSDLTASACRDDDARVSDAMITVSELQAPTLLAPWEPYGLQFEWSEDMVRSPTSKKPRSMRLC